MAAILKWLSKCFHSDELVVTPFAVSVAAEEHPTIFAFVTLVEPRAIYSIRIQTTVMCFLCVINLYCVSAIQAWRVSAP